MQRSAAVAYALPHRTPAQEMLRLVRSHVWFATAALVLGACRGPLDPGPAPQATTRFDPTALSRARGIQGPLDPRLELVAIITGSTPAGVAVSASHRVFLSFPRSQGSAEFTTGEVQSGQLLPFPDGFPSRFYERRASSSLVSVQSLVVDGLDRLWLLDTGSIDLRDAIPAAPKLVAIDLRDNEPVRTIYFWPNAALPTTYLSDVRFDLSRGEEGVAFVSDSSSRGPNAILVVDLATGHVVRRLEDHVSTKATPRLTPMVEERPLSLQGVRGRIYPLRSGVDGIALSPDGSELFYRPLVSHHLFRASATALADEALSDESVARTVEDLGDIGYASDGLEMDDAGRLYLTDYEHAAIHRRQRDGTDEILVSDPRLIWPDSLALADDGYLYVTVNQLGREPRFNEGRDMRKAPYAVFRIKVDAHPVRRKPG